MAAVWWNACVTSNIRWHVRCIMVQNEKLLKIELRAKCALSRSFGCQTNDGCQIICKMLCQEDAPETAAKMRGKPIEAEAKTNIGTYIRPCLWLSLSKLCAEYLRFHQLLLHTMPCRSMAVKRKWKKSFEMKSVWNCNRWAKIELRNGNTRKIFISSSQVACLILTYMHVFVIKSN